MSIIPTRSYGADPSPLFPPSAKLHQEHKVKADDEAILHMDPMTKFKNFSQGQVNAIIES